MRQPYLRYAAAALFLALGAYGIAALAENALRPAAVTAQLATVTETLYAEGQILLDEIPLDCPFAIASEAVAKGERVRAGDLLCTGKNGESLRAPCAGFYTGDRIVRGGWSFEAELNDAGSLYEGKELTLVIADREYPATVTELDGRRLSLRCRQGLCEVLDTQVAEGTLRLGSVTGIRLPADAVGEDENGRFVTLLRAGIEKKQYIEIIYEKDDCLLAAPGDIGEGARVLLGQDTGEKT